MSRHATPARAVLTISIPYHLRQRVAADANRYSTTLSATVAALIAKHYKTTIEGKRARVSARLAEAAERA